VSRVVLRNPLLGSRELKGGKVCRVRHKRCGRAIVDGALLVPGRSGASEVCPGAAEKLFDLQDAFTNDPVYPRLCRPHARSGLPAIHVERQRRDAHFCLEALY
jgi:hypothetical protein